MSPRLLPRRARVAVAALALTTGLGAGLPLTSADAVPVEGHTGWSVLLCKFSDQAAEQHDAAWFSRFLITTGTGGVADYLADQSRGRIDLRGSAVRGWYRMGTTLAASASQSRWQRIQSCVSAAAAGGYTVPSGNRVVAIINGQIDSGSAGGAVLLDPLAWNVGFAAHEMLHGYGLGHSFSNDTSYQNASWSQPGEYDDPWDEMSAMAIYGGSTASFGTAAVGLNAYFRDKLGWIPFGEVLTLGKDGVASRTVTLTSLETAAAGGTRLIRIPFDPADLNHYYTVELRQKTGWSSAIPATTVLIHEVKGGTPYLQRKLDGTRALVQSLSANGVTVRVNSVSTSTASVSVSTQITGRCVQGYVWREANSSDHVCVTSATRTQVRADNAAAASRWVNGAYGPHTCINGYVWREAFSGDDVCTLPANRTQAAADNAAAASRINPARLVGGPNVCVSGYVWRAADTSDYVCVTPAVRTATANDNAVKASRWTSGAYGPHTCISGYVWREAWPADDVCVTGTVRSQVASDNQTAGSRVAVP
ncbi:MAG: hypothetical protein U0Q15_06220 [Kineosporiaceae bacterium]